VILVSPRIDTASWTDLRINSPDITAIELHTDFGKIQIFNIYNDCEHGRSLDAVKRWYADQTQTMRRNAHAAHMIWAGDFNRHHPLWESDANHHLFTSTALRQAQPLIQLLTVHRLQQILPKDTPTLEQSRTRTGPAQTMSSLQTP